MVENLGAFTYQQRDISLIQHNIELNFVYNIQSISHDAITLQFLDSSIYESDATPTEYSWSLNQNGTIIYTNDQASFVTTFSLTENITVTYTVTNPYGVSTLVRMLTFNIYSTIDALLARTSTAISKEIGGNNYKLLSLDSTEYDLIYSTMTDLMESGYIKTATGVSLEYLCVMWGVYRENGENDESLRNRLMQTIMMKDNNITKANLQNLIANSFGIPDENVEMIERTAIPDYSWASSINSDYLPYSSVTRPAEFTFFITDGPLKEIQMNSINQMINEARALGVYFNTVKVTFIVQYTTAIQLTEFNLYEDVLLEAIFGWSSMMWGMPGEVAYTNQTIATHTFTSSGNYVVTAYCYGTNFAEKSKNITIS